MPMPPALEKERIRPRATAQYEGAPVKRKKVQRRRLLSPRERVRRRTEQVRETARAIREGRAEAHPIVIEHGFHGPVKMSEKELGEVGSAFTESLIRTYAARRKGRKKKKPPRMATPAAGQEFG